jgi:hypothetical protein
LEVFRRHIWKYKVRIDPEAKTAVVPRLAKHYAASRATLAKDAQSFVH